MKRARMSSLRKDPPNAGSSLSCIVMLRARLKGRATADRSPGCIREETLLHLLPPALLLRSTARIRVRGSQSLARFDTRTLLLRLSVLFLTDLLTIALACECFLHAFLFAWFQVKRMALHFLDDVFSLHFALKPAQRILKGFAFLDTNFCQVKYTSRHA